MQLTSATTSPAAPPVWAQPTYVGLRVSTDREFSAAIYANDVRPLRATSLDSAVVEARELLAGGAFDVPGSAPLDAAKSVALLSDDGTSFRAGSLVELRMGKPQPAGLPEDGPHFEFWFEPGIAAVVDAKGIRLTH